jgi:hypothetical protein
MRYRTIASWIRCGGSRGAHVLEARKDKIPRARSQRYSGFVWSVAQFVGRRKVRAGRDRWCAADSAAARSRPAARLVAIRVRAGRYVAECRGHVLSADNAGRWRSRGCQLAALNGRLLLAVRGGDLCCDRRRRQQQCSNQREFLQMRPNRFSPVQRHKAIHAARYRTGARPTNVLILIRFLPPVTASATSLMKRIMRGSAVAPDAEDDAGSTGRSARMARETPCR